MNWANDRYPAKALSFFLILELVEPPIRYIRTTVHAGLFGFVPGFLLGTLGAVAIALLVRRFPGATVLEIGRATLGRFLGTLVACGYVAYYVLVGALSLRIAVEKEHALLLPSTPQWLMMLLLLTIIAYLVAHGAEPVARLAYPIIVVAVSITIFFYVAALGQGDLGRLVTWPEGGLAAIGRDALAVALRMDAIALLLVLAAFAHPPERLVRAALMGMGPAFLVLLLALGAVIGAFGTRSMTLYPWPAVAAIQTIVFPGFLVEKLDLVFDSALLTISFGGVSLFLLSAAVLIQRLLRLRQFERPALAVALAAFIVASLTTGIETLVRVRELFALNVSWVFTYALPLIMLGISALQGRRRVKAGRGRARGESV